MTDLSDSPPKFRGLLENPFRQGYIDFQYTQGDKIRDLRERIASIWSSPNAPQEYWLKRKRLEQVNPYYFYIEAWVILCKDTDGSYFILQDEDEIPINAPQPRTFKDVHNYLKSGAHTKYIQEHFGCTGIIFTNDCIQNTSLHICIDRVYEIPHDINYSVQLITLIALSGG